MISSHVLDTSLGQPASSVKIELRKKSDQNWILLETQVTNNDGRCVFTKALESGHYQLKFYIEDYFKALKQDAFFTDTVVEFTIKDLNRKYHVPLLLNPFGYSTYRGS